VIRLLLKRPTLNLTCKNCKGKTSAQVAKNSAIRSFIQKEQNRRRMLQESSKDSVVIQDCQKFDLKRYFMYKKQLKQQKKSKELQVKSFEEYKKQKNKISPDSF
jgi:arginyl-tRNA--protein-N-Asp/Glu arginylyltransferase